ncbi:IPExxxVDY family protein [Parasediminibacterium sp. JCM 36343]|uniref:IPExxxVDY family protein n=1 Tax=Parasediminibacterium sp. JCM 36343 TaxID=3374279 RepID=UPI00397D0431
MKPLKLNIDILNDDFFEGTRLLGIIAPIKKHLFCWRLNDTMGFSFNLSNEIEIPLRKKERNYFFALYRSQQYNSSLEHLVYYNQCDGEYLLPEFKHIDYLWLIRGDSIEEEHYQWIKQGIKSIADVQFVTELSNEQIKTKGNLVF